MNLELVSILITIVLGIYIYWRSPRKPLYSGFGGLTISLGLWSLANYLNTHTSFLSAYFWVKFSFSLFVVGTVPFVRFVYYFPREDKLTRYYLWHSLIHSLFGVISLYLLFFTNSWIKEIVLTSSGPKISFGPAAYFWIGVVVLASTANYTVLGFRARRVSGRERTQMELFGLSLIPFFVYTGLLSVEMMQKGSFVLSETSTQFLVPFVLVNLYTIVRHRFLDIRVAFRNLILKTLVGFLLFLVMSGVRYLGLVSIQNWGNSTILLVGCLAVAFLYEPLMDELREVTNRYLFQREFTRAELLRRLNREMAESVDLQNLKNKIERTLHEVVQVKFSRFAPEEESKHLKPFLWENPEPIVIDELKLKLEDPVSERRSMDLQLFNLMEEKEIAAVVPLVSKDSFVDLIYLGEKKNRESFNQNDFRILETFQYQAGVALENAQLVSELERDKIMLSAERNKLSVVLSGIKDGVIALDREKRVVVFNQAAKRITGWAAEEALGKDVGVIFSLFTEEEEEIGLGELCPERVSKDQDQLTFHSSDALVKTKGGRLKPIAVSAATIKESEFADVSYIFTFIDLSPEKELERMKLDFVAMAAHELRTPLTSIMGYLSILKEETEEKLGEEHLTFVDRAIDSSRRLFALMENLLSITRIEEGSLSTQARTINWGQMLKEKVEEFRGRAEQRGLSIEIENEGEIAKLPPVRADPLRIPEVLNNLLDNAITFTQEGGVKIWCEYDEKREKVVTHIKDTGPGIPEESLEHLFEKFYRIAGPLEEGSKGTGLGLYISKEIVEMHGGEIWVESVEGEGSIFSFSLPTAKGESLEEL